VEAIVLCGGTAWRLKPHIWVPKPKLKINDETLISYQVKWLKEHGMSKIVLATNVTNLIDDTSVTYSIEKKKLGTGGAVKKAAEQVGDERVYVMNVDDIVFYDPGKLYEYANSGAAILVAKPALPFGRVLAEDTYVTEFAQKPQLDFYVSTGHYVFETSTIRRYFPDEGDMELKTLPKLADERMIRAYEYEGEWLTINTMKELLNVRERLRKHNSKKQ
jgi:NDP-sugar pyrophosphorylase family protein